MPGEQPQPPTLLTEEPVRPSGDEPAERRSAELTGALQESFGETPGCPPRRNQNWVWVELCQLQQPPKYRLAGGGPAYPSYPSSWHGPSAPRRRGCTAGQGGRGWAGLLGHRGRRVCRVAVPPGHRDAAGGTAAPPGREQSRTQGAGAALTSGLQVCSAWGRVRRGSGFEAEVSFCTGNCAPESATAEAGCGTLPYSSSPARAWARSLAGGSPAPSPLTRHHSSLTNKLNLLLAFGHEACAQLNRTEVFVLPLSPLNVLSGKLVGKKASSYQHGREATLQTH